MNFEDLKKVLLAAPSNQLDDSVKPLLEAWDDPPTPLQVLEVVDKCVRSALASGFALSTLQGVYEMVCRHNGVTHEEVVKQATWRD